MRILIYIKFIVPELLVLLKQQGGFVANQDILWEQYNHR
jgi:hypothetical protein